MSRQLIEAALRGVTEIVDSGDFDWSRQELNSERDPKAAGFAGISSQGKWRVVVARFTPRTGPYDVAYDGAAVCMKGPSQGTILHLTPELAEKCWLQADETAPRES
jgi:hypothetical protein